MDQKLSLFHIEITICVHNSNTFLLHNSIAYGMLSTEYFWGNVQYCNASLRKGPSETQSTLLTIVDLILCFGHQMIILDKPNQKCAPISSTRRQWFYEILIKRQIAQTKLFTITQTDHCAHVWAFGLLMNLSYLSYSALIFAC